MENDTRFHSSRQKFKTFDQKDWISENFNYKKDSGNWARIFNRITGIPLIGSLFQHIYSELYNGLNGIWNIFRDYKMHSWAKYSILSGLILFGLTYISWGCTIIFSIPYLS